MSTEETDSATEEKKPGTTCPNCAVAVSENERFCHNCGHALMPVAAAASAAPEKVILPDPEIEKKIKQARTALLVVAILQILGALLFLGLQIHDTFAIIGVFLVSGIFWILWFWAKRNPLPATIAGLVTFITVHLADALVDPKQIFQGIIMKIIVVVFLVKGVSAGLSYRAAQQRLKNDQAAQP